MEPATRYAGWITTRVIVNDTGAGYKMKTTQI